MSPSNQEKNIFDGKDANLSGVRFSTCSSRSMYFGFASEKQLRKRRAPTIGSWRIRVMKGISYVL